RQRSCADFQRRQARDARVFQGDSERWAREVFRVLKPGAYLVAMGGTRTFHRLTAGIEDAGFEIRDCLSWLYGQGFPKSLNLSDGRGTALKPAWEPIILARKPLAGTVAANVRQHGTGALNINACRMTSDASSVRVRHNSSGTGDIGQWRTGKHESDTGGSSLGRWPANAIFDEEAAAMLDEMSGELFGPGGPAHVGTGQNSWFGGGHQQGPIYPGEQGGASRFFYVAKPDRAERDVGCDGTAHRTAGECTDRKDGSAGLNNPRAGAGRTGGGRNIHPTVKPLALMRWLVRLVTPAGGTVLDPFTGSGTTGMACLAEGFNFIGIEREPEYVEIARARIGSIAPLLAREITA
ncbi:MAG: site-specific DNA-methyltransferase, partial [Chloroflexota bacterium]